jgi:GNAT superfamily N-acetyltransferase
MRAATPADAAEVARQRVAMFLEMGSAVPAVAARLTSATEAYLREAMPRGEYLGWLASPTAEPRVVVAGAGVQVRRVLPFPRRRPGGQVEVAQGRQAIVLNVYTEPAYRRQGLARRLMDQVLEWARVERIESLVLHAAPDGRPLYEKLGFVATNEMRYMGPLGEPGGP